MEDKSIIRLKKKLDVSDLSGEKVMIDFESGKYYLLKGVGNDIWDMIQQDISYGDIITNILKEYDVDDKTCRETVQSFMEKLLENDFIEVL